MVLLITQKFAERTNNTMITPQKALTTQQAASNITDAEKDGLLKYAADLFANQYIAKKDTLTTEAKIFSLLQKSGTDITKLISVVTENPDLSEVEAQKIYINKFGGSNYTCSH